MSDPKRQSIEPGPSASNTARNQLHTKQEAEVPTEPQEQNITGMRLALIIAAIISAIFLVALDRTIIATAVPKISDQFHAISDISWYASSYLLTSSATQLLWGRLYTFYSTKILFLAAVVVFEVGSAVCGAAPTSKAFIIGRAIAGIGSAGIQNGSTVIITQVLPLHKRPLFIGLMGSTFGISAIIGPLLGGAFTDQVTWRWCFYINLPIGGLTLLIIFFFLRALSVSSTATLKRQLIRLDPLGTVLFLPGVICFLLALQWAGTTYSWDNGRIIALFVLAGVLLITFWIIQIWRKEDATIPPRIIKQRSIACGAAYTSCIYGSMVAMLYALPLWFQGVKNTSAVQSGIDNIPMVLALVVASIICGKAIAGIGHYVPFMFVAAALMAVGAGLITTFKVDTGHAAWIGYQVLFGLGLGCGMQQPMMAAQTVLAQADVSIGVALMFLFQSLGGAIWVTVSQNLYTNYLVKMLPGVSGIDSSTILRAGATGLQDTVPKDKLDAVLLVYNAALHRAFFVPVALACVTILPALGMEWRNIKNESEKREKAKLVGTLNEDMPRGEEKIRADERDA
ncbi:major facilitator superfamily domain-containing protein [Penicillium argentinense]|uniref:Major facilitator superfamily domain-containing protein n=1 Tax=Penicillium argentinense TaxID=1131581 RepID=A0A9W9G691_9EURO|nr:major facilitator superfamily domain-containing protein [Penicillium argentinense]KAJ5112729.1 major facilitator superfamily domain-containing protein [Penicillium argentinense]